MRLLILSLVLVCVCAPAQAKNCPVFESTMTDIEQTLDAIDAAKRP